MNRSIKKIINQIVFFSILITVLLLQTNTSAGIEPSSDGKIINSNLTISQDTVWENTIILNGTNVEIEENATLTLKPGATIIANNGSNIYVFGKLIASGKKDKMVKFSSNLETKQDFSLTFHIEGSPNSEIIMEHFILENGGGNQDIASLPALTARGKVRLKDGIVRRNKISAIRNWGKNFEMESCELYENENFTLENKYLGEIKAEDNWWGSEKGPNHAVFNSQNKISGNIDYRPWQEKGPIPIIILPGIGGSLSFKLLSSSVHNYWWLNPIGTSAYRILARNLVLSGYKLDHDFFWGLYDWRLSNRESAQIYLEDIIEKAKEASGHFQVNLVAHSMGGLMARSYIQSNNFKDDVDRLLMAGTPHLGSSETYPIWEGGKFNSESLPIDIYLWYLGLTDFDFNDVNIIRQNFPSISEMLPIYDYLVDKESGKIKEYRTQKIKNEFLEELEKEAFLLKERVIPINLAGKGEKTLEKIIVSQSGTSLEMWRDGIPDPIIPPKDTLEGDGTVTQKSAISQKNVSSSPIIIESSHGNLFEKGLKVIMDELKIEPKNKLLYDVLNYFIVTAEGPIRIIIEKEMGEILSSSENSLPESELFEENFENKKLLFANFPLEIKEATKIKVKVIGLGSGKFNIAFWHAGEGNKFEKIEDQREISEEAAIDYKINLEDNGSGSPKINLVKISSQSLIRIISPRNGDSLLNWQLLKPEISVFSENQGFDGEKVKLSYFLDDIETDSTLDLGKIPLGTHSLKVKGEFSGRENGNNSFSQEPEVNFTLKSSLKSLATLANRFYEERELRSWDEKSKLANVLSEAYQCSSNGDYNCAKLKIASAKDSLNNLENRSTKEAFERIKESIEYLEKNPG